MEFHGTWSAPILMTWAVPRNSMDLRLSQFRWHEQFHGISWNFDSAVPWNSMGLGCANFDDTSSSMEFHGTSIGPIYDYCNKFPKFGDRPLSELIRLTDAYIRHSGRWVIHFAANVWLGTLFFNPQVTYSISQEICTRFCCALLCCGYVIVHNELTWSIYPYSSGLLCWHWGNR